MQLQGFVKFYEALQDCSKYGKYGKCGKCGEYKRRNSRKQEDR